MPHEEAQRNLNFTAVSLREAKPEWGVLPLLFLTLAIAPTPGRWECQSMGADTEANVSVRGDEILIYRAMYPEFEGKSYKLEHLFKLKLTRTKLTGQLLVRDDPRNQFTVLRAIEGELISEGELRLDGTPFKLLEAGELKSPVPAPAAPVLGYFAQVVQRAATAEDLFALHAGISLTREGLAALAAGEASFEKGAFRPATLSFQKALGAGVPVSLFAEHAARAWLALQDCAHADGMVSAAQRLDPESPDTVALVRDAGKACPKLSAKVKPAKAQKAITLEQREAELGAGAVPTSFDEVVEILRLDEVNRFPAAVAFISTQQDLKARALHGQLELAWAEGLSLLSEMNVNLAARLRELTAQSEARAAADGLSADELKALGELRAEVIETTQTARVLELAATEHLTRGLAIAAQVIKANPDSYLGYRVAADSYRLQRDWKSFDRALAKVEKANPGSNGLLFLKGVAAAQRDRDAKTAVKFLSAALLKDPKFARAQAHLVLIASSLDEARDELDKLAAINPHHPFVVWTGPALAKLEEH